MRFHNGFYTSFHNLAVKSRCSNSGHNWILCGEHRYSLEFTAFLPPHLFHVGCTGEWKCCLLLGVCPAARGEAKVVPGAEDDVPLRWGELTLLWVPNIWEDTSLCLCPAEASGKWSWVWVFVLVLLLMWEEGALLWFSKKTKREHDDTDETWCINSMSMCHRTLRSCLMLWDGTWGFAFTGYAVVTAVLWNTFPLLVTGSSVDFIPVQHDRPLGQTCRARADERCSNGSKQMWWWINTELKMGT